MRKISAVIICKNEEKNIKRCLESVKWADEIVIIDAFSSDRTVEMCKDYTNKIYQNEFIDFCSQKNFAISKAENDWVLLVDADELVTGQLQDEISRLSDNEYQGYCVPRKNIIFGRYLKYGGHQKDLQLRLFKKSRSHFENPIHEKVVVEGERGILNNYLEHYTSPNLSEYTRRLNQYTDIESRLLFSRNKKNRALSILAVPIAKFVRQYFLRAGSRDGMEGFIYYVLSSFYYSLKFMKHWELIRNARKKLG